MSELFSADWMGSFKGLWNDDATLSADLAKVGFSSTIGYGFISDNQPLGVLTVESGKVVAAGTYDGETLNWDLRASPETWEAWVKKAPGLMGLGLAYTSRKLKFAQGDYAAMVKDPQLAGPFVRSFELMSKI